MTLDSLLCTEVVRDVSFPVYKKNLIVILLMRLIVLENSEFTLLSYAPIAKLYRGMLCSIMYTIMSYFLSHNIKSCVSNISEVQLNQKMCPNNIPTLALHCNSFLYIQFFHTACLNQ